ncbi:MAG: SpoIIE family protein phosphatase [Formivibrio sp.]|nr:SpoIIE family protein phosphatase [Formivibrio sp.]
MKILVVDDTESVLLLMSRFVGALGHHAIPARNGLEAVECWRNERPDLVLMDMMMPVMSGAEAAAIIKAEAGETWIPIVFVTGMGEDAALAEAIECCGDDCLSKPVNFRVLEAKLKAFGRTLELNRKVREQSEKLSDYFDHSEEEKGIVRHLMEQMVNAERLADPRLEYWLTPAESLSGDMIAAARTPGESLHIMLADGIGHGITAALNVLPLTQPFYSMTEKGHTLPEILAEMNNKVRQVLPVGRFVAVALVSISEVDGLVEIWNGGMPELQILDADCVVVEACKSFSLPLGVVPSHAMEFSPKRFYFSRPGAVLAYSDGLVEARNLEGEAFGLPRLLEAIAASSAGERVEAVRSRLFSFLDGKEYHDDISLVYAGFGLTVSNRLVNRDPDFVLDPNLLEQLVADNNVLWRYSLTLGIDELRRINVVSFIMTFVNDIKALSGCNSDIFLILSVLFANALERGVLAMEAPIMQGTEGREQHQQERSARLNALQSGRVEMGLSGVSFSGRMVLRIHVKDSGKGFNWRAWRESKGDHLKVSDHGLDLVQSLCASMEFRGVGNEVVAYYLPGNA